ncbi:conjugation system SOS inhibitor PsiB family protein [Pantoea dispersa]|uniref:conjugation system SOS inhibitor PsiB family protein n=1 Tax=Pantoea dispersa TaxID=59814 RepID=UPI003D15EBFE
MKCGPRGGGAYPVHLRLTRADAAPLALGLVSPSCCSAVWCAIVADTRTRCYLRLYVSDRLEPAAQQVILAKIAEYTRAGFTGAGELAAAIRMESTRYDPDLTGTGATSAGVTKLSMGLRTDAALEIHRLHGFLNR